MPVLDYEDYTVGSVEIKYNTHFDDELYSTYAYLQYKNLNYLIEYMSFEDNCTSIFEELFA